MKAKQTESVGGLIALVRAGEQQAFADLLAIYKPLLKSEVSRRAAGLSREDAEDLGQVALLAFYRAAMNFDLKQSEVEFGLYAKVCVSNAIASQLRVWRRYTSALSLTEIKEPVDTENPARRMEDEEAFTALHARIRSVLSAYEWRVWTLYTAGYRSGEIARLLARPSHSVENAVYRIRQKLRQALGDLR